MIKLKNLITEVQWENSVQSHIYAGNIPMTPKVIHRIFGVKKIVALHVSDIDNFERLAKLQGTKKSVSMTNSFRPSFIGRGVWAGAGIAAVVEGDMMIGLNADLMSAPDKQGRR
jgi:succinate dehydrogenase/fumarate reductase cytochrome b subunit